MKTPDGFDIKALRISVHACERYIERIDANVSMDEARATIYAAVLECYNNGRLKIENTQTNFGWVAFIYSDNFGCEFKAAFQKDEYFEFYTVSTVMTLLPVLSKMQKKKFLSPNKELENQLTQVRQQVKELKAAQGQLEMQIHNLTKGIESRENKITKLKDNYTFLFRALVDVYLHEKARNTNASKKQINRIVTVLTTVKPDWGTKHERLLAKYSEIKYPETKLETIEVAS